MPAAIATVPPYPRNSSLATMSTCSSISVDKLPDEPRKKGTDTNSPPLYPLFPRPLSTANTFCLPLGARGGKRSVTHLSKAQLARKRANDREAQRNIRARTKEHIENLEKKVKELEQIRRPDGVERTILRNKELEAEVAELRERLKRKTILSHASLAQSMTDELLIPRKQSIDWMGQAPTPSGWPQSSPALQVSMKAEPGVEHYADNPLYSSTNSFDEEASQLFTSQATPAWNEAAVFGPQAPSKPCLEWTLSHPTFSQPSQFATLQPEGFLDVINPGSFGGSSTQTTCWQSQPSTYTWQIPIKLKAPSTIVDHLMLRVIHYQRDLALNGAVGEELIGPDFPSVQILFNREVDPSQSSTLSEVMDRYSQLLSNRGFAEVPEKLGSFMCMYRFVQWQISPTSETFHRLHAWQAPEQSQLEIPHPAWMDLPPWGSFRDKVIRNQARYDNVTFQSDYAANLSVNFPDASGAVVCEDGQLKISRALFNHIGDLANMSMKKPFAEKYPEFRDVCRFDEV
jgi:hypothetical protein